MTQCLVNSSQFLGLFETSLDLVIPNFRVVLEIQLQRKSLVNNKGSHSWKMGNLNKLWVIAGAFAAGWLVAFVVIPYQGVFNVQGPKHDFRKKDRPYPGLPKTETLPLHSPQSPPVSPPLVKETLQRPNFSTHRAEYETLNFIRKHGLVSNLPDADAIKALPNDKMSAIVHSYLDNSDILCRRMFRMGKVEDGGWEVCDDYEWRPIPPCIVYSFGINYDFSFDDDVGKVYGCDVYSFDPSMTKQPTYQRSGRVMFYAYGIGGQSGSPPVRTKQGWVLHSLSNFRAMLNHTDKVIDVLKMDVESSEWSAIPTMIRERQLDNVRQFLLEFHLANDSPDFLRPRLEMMASLERIGFRKFYVTKNEACKRKAKMFPMLRTSCYEVHYVNTNFQRPGTGDQV